MLSYNTQKKKRQPHDKVTAGKAFSAGTVAITQHRKSRHRSITVRTQAHVRTPAHVSAVREARTTEHGEGLD